MPLPVPSYIAEANIESREITYLWDEWASKRDIYRHDADAKLQHRLHGLSQRGRIALVNGVAEWLVYRFKPLLHDALPLHALEAAWAGVVDRKYVLPLASFHDRDKEEWSGPIRGVIRRGLLFVSDTIDLGWANGDNSQLPVRVTNLTRYVLPHSEAFEEWIGAAIARLHTLSPWDADDYVGEVVPREALDCRRPFDPQATEVLIRRFLDKVAPEENPYLASRKTMLEWGFTGEPYTFDIARDRATRRRITRLGNP